MKYFAPLCALLLVGSLPGFATSVHSTSVNYQNQFHFKPSKHRATHRTTRGLSPKQAHESVKAEGPFSKTRVSHPNTQSHLASAKNVRRHTAPTGKVGYSSAAQIAAGGGTYDGSVSADFNGDGKQDIAGIVYAYDTTALTYIYKISIVLGNGDGTFQQPVLTSITDNDGDCDSIFAADLNGDKKSDLLIGHNPGGCGNSFTQPTVEVWLSNGDGTFTAGTNVVVPTSYSLAGGTLYDVNGDGKLDLVGVDENNPASVWTAFGNGDGTFQTPTSVALAGEAGYDLIVADLNGDGLLDIADIDYNTSQLTVYLATSATTYGPAASYTTADSNYNACSMSIGDLNNDGKPELVNANCSYFAGNDITVYVNNGDGTFATGVYYDGAMTGGTNSGAAPLYTEAVTVADVNGDGQADIVASNDYSGDVTILLGKGDGTVTVPTMGYATGAYPYTPPIVTDFNGDGFVDIVVPDDEFSFVYLKGYGDGTFHAARDYYDAPDAYSSSYGVASGDFNGDGYPDIVVGNDCSGCTNPLGITVFLSNPDGSLQSGITLGSSSTMWFAAVADFNGDGKLDIAATDNNAGTVSFFYGDGTGNFTAGPVLNADLANNAPYGVWVGDFNNDGHPDLAIANYNAPDITILLNDSNGTGNFGAPLPTLALNGDVWQGVAVADVNGDGNLDLVLPYWYGSYVGVLLGNGDGTFQAEQDLTLSDANGVAVADFNGDGKLDIAVTTYLGGGQDIGIALGNGDGTFGAFTLIASSLQDYNLETPQPMEIQTADVDGDGKVDLVYSNSEYGTVGVLFGVGDGTFFDPVEYPVTGYNWPLIVTDINHDGTPDVVTASAEAPGASVLLNFNGTGALGAYTIQSTGAQTVAAGSNATFTLTITPTNHYNGTITFACPAGLPSLATCSFSPSSVTLDGLHSQTVTLTITTKAPSTSKLRTRASVDPQGTPRPRSSAMLLASLNGVGVFGMFLAGSLKKRTRQSVLAVLALGLLFFLVGCGGSSNSSSKATTSTVTTSAATALVGQSVTFTGTVTAASGTPTGSVTFLDGTTTLGTGSLSGGSTTFKTSSLAAGVHSITISYAGDTSFEASTSTAVSQTVDNPGTPTGSYQITVTGTGNAGTNGVGNPSQSIKVNVTVQ